MKYLIAFTISILMLIILQIINTNIYPLSEFLIGHQVGSSFWISYYLIQKFKSKTVY